ncbi:MAG: glycosyltransferase family 87 protein [Gaiellales bacterium]
MNDRTLPGEWRRSFGFAGIRRPLAALYRRWAVPRRIGAYGICLAAGPFLAALFLLSSIRSGSFLIDFRYAFYPAGHAVLSGHSPYVALSELHAELIPFVYPAVAAWLFAPLALLPYGAAAVIYFALTVLVVWAGLAFLGVRDPRCYTVVCAWPAALDDFQTGALGGAMFLGLAILWRYRDRTTGSATLALVVAAKLFLWPLGAWLLLTRRWRAVAVAAIAGVVFLLLPWAAIGFAGLTSYPAMLQRLTEQEGGTSYALGSLVAALHLPHPMTYLLALTLALPGLRRLGDPDHARRDRGVLTGCLVLALALTPILWLHYLLVLLLPIALTHRRLSWVWWLPAAMLVAPASHPNGALFPLAVFWLVVSVIAFTAPRSMGESMAATEPHAGAQAPGNPAVAAS